MSNPASRPSVMVLAFDSHEVEEETAATVREDLEEALDTAMDRRFSVRYLSAMEPPVLPSSQYGRALESQESAVALARNLPVDLVVCGSAVGYGKDVEIIAKLLDARNASLLLSRAVYIQEGENWRARIAELANWLAMSLPRLIGLVGETQAVSVDSGAEYSVFVINVGADTGLLDGQTLSIFHKDEDVLRETGRARVAYADVPYSLCVLVSKTRFEDGSESDCVPQRGDLVLVR